MLFKTDVFSTTQSQKLFKLEQNFYRKPTAFKIQEGGGVWAFQFSSYLIRL